VLTNSPLTSKKREYIIVNTPMACTMDAQRKCNIVPQRDKLRKYVAYYRKLREEGKVWVPKQNSKLAMYCAAYGLDPITVINDRDCLLATAPDRQMEMGEIQFVKEQLYLYQTRHKAILENPPWIPTKGNKFRVWCEQHGIDVVQLVEGTIKLDDVLVH